MREPRAVIVGTGRSGSGYVARVLDAAGIRCGHESWWNPFGTRADGLAVDSSWCALPLGLDGYTGLVWHQLRHPLDVVSSLGKEPTSEGPYRDLQVRLMPWDPIDPIEWGMLAWHSYVEAAQRLAVRAWRLEDVDAGLVCDLAADLGRPLKRAAAEAAIAAVPRDYNCHGDGPRYSWVDLPVGGLRDRLMAWAKAWGWT